MLAFCIRTTSSTNTLTNTYTTIALLTHNIDTFKKGGRAARLPNDTLSILACSGVSSLRRKSREDPEIARRAIVVLIERGYHRGRKTTSCSTSQMCPVLSLSMGNEGRSVRLARTQQHKKTPAHLYHRALQLSIQSVSSTMQGLKLTPPLTC